MKKVAVLMSSYNGEKFIEKQIESILSQKNVDVTLIIRDDGSQDNTVKILKKFANYTNIRVQFGYNLGYTASFMELIRLIHNESYDYIAFSDQDDVWMSQKLCRAVDELDKKNNKYKLYFSALTFTDETGNIYGEKKYDRYNLTLKGAMVMSSVAGCTMVLNKNLADRVYISGKEIPDGIGHDGWILRCCLAYNGAVVYDEKSGILFRRHSSNTSNAGGHLYQKIAIVKYLFKTPNMELQTAKRIVNYFSDLPSENKCFLKKLSNYKKNFKNKFMFMVTPGLSSGILSIDIVIKALILLGKY